MTSSTVWASALAFACILAVLGLLLCIPFFISRLRGVHPVLDRVFERAAAIMGAHAPPRHQAYGNRHPAPKGFIRSLQVARYKKPAVGDVEGGAEDCCAICFSEYEAGELTIRLRCGHLYHKPCITSWLKLDAVCPICKAQLLQPQPPTKAPGCHCTQPQAQAQAQAASALAAAAAAAAAAGGDEQGVAGRGGSAPPPPAPVSAGGPSYSRPPQAATLRSVPLQLQLHLLDVPAAGVAGLSP